MQSLYSGRAFLALSIDKLSIVECKKVVDSGLSIVIIESVAAHERRCTKSR